ncbi:STY0301 family protein [Xanthomonas sp. SHU 166]|uniref:STY0301 family protein n=1 Tax=Xanthomonas sp. SHU 166 TaxID=1591170 RepID=UPI0003A5ABF0|nr:STY0301 family protein [Xanthomonas sp. SHU 166]
MVSKGMSATARCALPLLIAVSAAPAAAREMLQCPERLRIAEAQLQSPDVPADVRVDLAAAPPMRLFSSNVYSGPPREMAALVPSNEDARRPGDAGVSVWRFDAPDPHGLYLVCGYGPDGRVQVSRRVGDVARCEARPLRASGTGPAAGTLFVCE